MTSRREAREARAAAEARETASEDAFSALLTSDDSADDQFGSMKRRRPLLKSLRFWIPVTVVILLIAAIAGGAFVAKRLYDDAMATKG
ncbi:MAG: hypothetical protein WA971_04475, partial [Microbacterium sp.]